jgi:sec1 family domain-containing protein 1
LNFVVAEHDLFTLTMGNQTYYTLNSGTVSDTKLDALIDRIVVGLYSVCVTMGKIPIIRCPKGGPAELVGAKLDRKLRDHVLSSKNDNLFSGQGRTGGSQASSRPVLIILDRSVDMVPMLSHSWTYQCLVSDVLRMRLNRITVETPIDENNLSKGTTKRSYDLTSNDFFWARNAPLPFPKVAEDIDVRASKDKVLG